MPGKQLPMRVHPPFVRTSFPLLSSLPQGFLHEQCRRNVLVLLILISAPFCASAQTAFRPTPGGIAQQTSTLFQQLACGNCHAGIEPSEVIYHNAPTLRDAGIRYNVAYLFSYLGQPSRVRGHIGASRMPDFFLDEKERLALALFLAEQNAESDELRSINREHKDARNISREIDVRKLIVEELKCTSCHTFEGHGGSQAIELLHSGWRLNSDWLLRYLAYPQAFDPQTSMPAFFFSREQSGLVEMIPRAEEKLRALVTYLDSTGRREREKLDALFLKAKSRYPTMTAAVGEKIFRALNCAACHEHPTIKPWQNAPDLSALGNRVQSEWLFSYLKKPEPIRPFGFYPGTGSRMPDYRLTAEEWEIIRASFNGQSSGDDSYRPRSLSYFSKAKAERMMRERLPCLGCHSLNGEGGKIAPDLSLTARRLQSSFILQMLREPHNASPGTIMPKIPMTASEQLLVVDYLLQASPQKSAGSYLSFAEHPILQFSDTSTTSGLYRRYCAPCHGETGRGDGFNAPYLPIKPADHTSRERMSARPDDTLFDGIYSGGAILNKSHLMPAFGTTLSREQITALVRYVRELCQCEGPAWSRK